MQKFMKMVRGGKIKAGMVIKFEIDSFKGMIVNENGCDFTMNELNFCPPTRSENMMDWMYSPSKNKPVSTEYRTFRNLRAVNNRIFLVNKVNRKSIQLIGKIYTHSLGHNSNYEVFTLRTDKLTPNNNVMVQIIE